MRYKIQMHKPSREFSRCWHAAGQHLENRGQGALSWLKHDLRPPFLAHLSFRIGNQLIFVRVEDSKGILPAPGNRFGTRRIAQECKGISCTMPMRRFGSNWIPLLPNWGLADLGSGNPIDPVALISEEKVAMTDWELHDFGVQIVRNHVTKKLGHQLMSSQGNPKVDPSLWFAGNEGPEWVVVRVVRAPDTKHKIPTNIREIADSVAHLSSVGHIASVIVRSAETVANANTDTTSQPLWRGYGMHANIVWVWGAKLTPKNPM